MICQKCSSDLTHVIDSRLTYNNTCVRRRHKCLKCGYRFTTYEMTKNHLVGVARNIAEDEIKINLRERILNDIDIAFSQLKPTE